MKSIFPICLMAGLLLVSSTTAHSENMSSSTSKSTLSKDAMIRTLIVSLPLESTDQYLKSIWKQTKSPDKKESKAAWNCLAAVWKYCDGMGCHFFTRFCWNVCREDPLAFYLRYLSGDKEAFNYYKLASQYDIVTFRNIDKIDKNQFISVLNRTKQEIGKYNSENLINDTKAIKALDDYISDANNRLAQVK